MENEIQEEGGVTLGYIFRTIFSQKWLALLIAAVITVIGTLGLYLTGRKSVVYSVSFVLQLPYTGDSVSSSSSYTYPDGASFYFTDLISARNLKEVASREGFDDIDVDNIVKKGDISISRAVDRVPEDTQSGVYDLNYTIQVKAKYFDGEDQARDFIEALILFPREHICSMNINYDQSLTASKSLITYDGRLDELKEQAEFILSKYNEFIGVYGQEFAVKDGNTLGHYQRLLQSSLFANSVIDNLKVKALNEKLVMSDKDGNPLKEALEQYESDLLRKKEEKAKIEGALKRLYSGSEGQTTSVVIDDAETVMEYTLQIEQLDMEIAYYEQFTAENCKVDADFDKKVNEVEAQVEAFTKEFSEIAAIVYTNKTTVNYLNTSIIEVEGGRGLILSAGISLVAGLVIAAIVAYIVGWNKQRKTLASEDKVVTVPVQNEAQLQAAATDETKEETNKKDKK